jgi:hypothetical protein
MIHERRALVHRCGPSELYYALLEGDAATVAELTITALVREGALDIEFAPEFEEALCATLREGGWDDHPAPIRSLDSYGPRLARVLH